jgi:hypothetical protein
VLAVAEVAELAVVLVDGVTPVSAPLLELSDNTAKSIRPEVGFRIMSLIAPTVWPWASLICEPIIWEARTS